LHVCGEVSFLPDAHEWFFGQDELTCFDITRCDGAEAFAWDFVDGEVGPSRDFGLDGTERSHFALMAVFY
jgi:hypothetical protein